MLVLSREIGQQIVIGNDIVITVVDIRNRTDVRIGVDAPKHVPVDRVEIREAKRRWPEKRRDEGFGCS